MMLYDGPKICCDIHHEWRNRDELIAYLPQRWRDFMRRADGSSALVDPPMMVYAAPGGVTARVDALPDNGDPAGSDYALMRDQLLDAFDIQRVILAFNNGQTAGVANVELATELCRAANRWQLEQWLSNPDERLHGSLVVPTQEPVEAAAEIRRHGAHPRVCEVVMHISGLGKPLGDPVYHPIYEAAAEMDLTIALHVGGEMHLPAMAQMQAGGLPNTRLERHNVLMQPIHHYMASFMVHGVFEKYPGLRLMVKETGIALFPWLLWELEAAYDLMRLESTWIRRRPIDYFLEHIWVTTQPLDESPKPDQLVQLLETVDGFEERMCFATDYPHHDTDDPRFVERRLPERWWPKIFFENPLKAYNWQAKDVTTAAQEASRRAA